MLKINQTYPGRKLALARCRSLWGKRSANKILMRIVHLQKLKYDLKT